MCKAGEEGMVYTKCFLGQQTQHYIVNLLTTSSDGFHLQKVLSSLQNILAICLLHLGYTQDF